MRRPGTPALIVIGAAVIAVAAALYVARGASPPAPGTLLAGADAYGDWRRDVPGVRRLIRVEDLPKPYATPSAGNGAALEPRPQGAVPKVPEGFKVAVYAQGFSVPRTLRRAPNGDMFLAETQAGQIRVLRGAPALNQVFATGLRSPFGIGFYPPGPDPKYVYVGNTDSVVRFPYQSGDTQARGPAETVIPHLPTGGHWTRDVVFSPDGRRMYVSVGSGSNDAEGMERKDADTARAYEAGHGLGAAWGAEEGRADVLVFDPDGGGGRIFATGLRNCVGMAIQPGTDTLWCSTNERDGLGDDLPPDYVTRVTEGAYYGWPWYYLGANEDPRHANERPDLAGKARVPDVLIQAHSAPLGMTFYDGGQFPQAFRGDGFVALHGSWNRSQRTGYKVARILMKDGVPTGAYEDFMTGLIDPDNNRVWGRPVGVGVAADGSLLVSEDGNGVIWRISYGG